MRLLLTAYAAVLLALTGVAISGAILLYRDSAPNNHIEAVAAEHRFDFVTWHLRHFPEKWLYRAGHVFDSGRSRQEEDSLLVEYFLVVADLRRLEDEDPGSPEISRLEAERARRENQVEEILESRMTGILEEQGLTMGPPPFTDLDLVFPPVDFELEAPTRVLVVSPRNRIELAHDYLLSPGLPADTAADIERQVEAGNSGEEGVSALVVTTGGVGTYPAVVSSRAPSSALIDTAFHEWIHNYLAFFPLGASYFRGAELRTINETVADLAGRELARLYLERYGELRAPLPDTASAPSPSPPGTPAEPAFDFTREMRALRLAVERLLSAGRIAEAEALMEERRLEFAERGHHIRRLNQAYFAFYGTYANTPASIDPIGPKINRLFQRSASVGEFVRRAAGITSEAELDQVLAEF